MKGCNWLYCTASHVNRFTSRNDFHSMRLQCMQATRWSVRAIFGVIILLRTLPKEANSVALRRPEGLLSNLHGWKSRNSCFL